MHLAQRTIGRRGAGTDDPRVAGFMAAIDRVNAPVRRMPGWRVRTCSAVAAE